jgi:hypothetical protein
MRGSTMNNIAETRTRIDSTVAANYALPALLAVNTFALLALERLGGIPNWIKTAAAIFLSF